MQFTIVALAFSINVSLTLYAITRYGSKNGVGLIYQGECERVTKLNQGLHLLLNILSTAMLSASNYCMQLQVAPRRHDVDEAHRRGDWLDIGVPSMRNLFRISKIKFILWLILALSSLPLHLL